jgi:hypothetical protein
MKGPLDFALLMDVSEELERILKERMVSPLHRRDTFNTAWDAGFTAAIEAVRNYARTLR